MNILNHIKLYFFPPFNSKFKKGDHVDVKALKNWKDNSLWGKKSKLTDGHITKIKRYKYTHVGERKYFYLYLVEFQKDALYIKDFWFSESELLFIEKEDERDYKLKLLLDDSNG